jgi:hypothetical protein
MRAILLTLLLAGCAASLPKIDAEKLLVIPAEFK